LLARSLDRHVDDRLLLCSRSAISSVRAQGIAISKCSGRRPSEIPRRSIETIGEELRQTKSRIIFTDAALASLSFGAGAIMKIAKHRGMAPARDAARVNWASSCVASGPTPPNSASAS